MKKIFLLLITVYLSSIAIQGSAKPQNGVYVSYQEFYDQLAPYGQWISDVKYGYVWIPNVPDGFRPYFTEGHWVMTDCGNTWVSYYPWGWACFHYGSWIYNDYYGWIWIPGNLWGPGWVAWRSGDANIGWAPLFPGAEWTGADYNCPADWWVFLHAKYFYLPRYFNVWRGDVFNGPRHTRKLLSETGIDANTYQNGDSKYYSGPLAATVHQITKQPVKIYKLTIATVRGIDSVTGNTVNIYQAKRMPGESPENQSAHPAFANMVEAPEPIRRPEEIHLKWNQQRPFKEFLQRINPMWNPQFIRDSPPYYNFPREQSMFGN